VFPLPIWSGTMRRAGNKTACRHDSDFCGHRSNAICSQCRLSFLSTFTVPGAMTVPSFKKGNRRGHRPTKRPPPSISPDRNRVHQRRCCSCSCCRNRAPATRRRRTSQLHGCRRERDSINDCQRCDRDVLKPLGCHCVQDLGLHSMHLRGRRPCRTRDRHCYQPIGLEVCSWLCTTTEYWREYRSLSVICEVSLRIRTSLTEDLVRLHSIRQIRMSPARVSVTLCDRTRRSH